MDRYNDEPNDELQPMLQSIKGMRRAEAPSHVFNRVMEQMHRPVARVVPISRISLVAASLAVLIGLNIALLVAKQNKVVDTNAPMEIYGTSTEYGYSY